MAPAVLLAVVTGAAEGQAPNVFERTFFALYPGWDMGGGQVAQVFEPRPMRVRLEMQCTVDPEGGAVKELSAYFPIPPNTPSQRIAALVPLEADHCKLAEAETGQALLHYELKDLQPGTTFAIGWELEGELAKVIHPMDVLAECCDTSMVPPVIARVYTQDGDKYKLGAPLIRDAAAAVKQMSATYPEAVYNAYNLVADTIEYVMDNRHDPAPDVLARGTGSCSEYSYAFIAICRALGIPARYVGGTVYSAKSDGVDDVFHRWVEVWFPGYGWVPFDSTWGRLDPARRASNFGVQQDNKLVLSVHWGPSKELGWAYTSAMKYTPADEKKPAKVQSKVTAYWQR